MPILILFAAILAVRGLMSDPIAEEAVKVSPFVGLNFVWEPKFDSLLEPRGVAGGGRADFLHAVHRHGVDSLLRLVPQAQ